MRVDDQTCACAVGFAGPNAAFLNLRGRSKHNNYYAASHVMNVVVVVCADRVPRNGTWTDGAVLERVLPNRQSTPALS